MNEIIEKFLYLFFPPVKRKNTMLPIISDENMDNNLRNQVYIVQQQLDNNQELFEKLTILVKRLEKHEARTSTKGAVSMFHYSVLIMSLLLVGYIAGQTDISKSIHPDSEIIKNSNKGAISCEKI